MPEFTYKKTILVKNNGVGEPVELKDVMEE